MRLPGVAPGLPPWRGGILLLNHNREIKRAGSVPAPGPAITTKNKHLLAIYAIPTRGFTAAVSVFSPSTPRAARRSGLTLSLSKGVRGTPPAKPLICKSKIRLVRLGDAASGRGQTPPVRLLCSSSPNSVCRQKTSPGCRFVLVHRLSVFRRYSFVFMLFRENKNPACISASRVEKVLFRSLPACRESIQLDLLFRRCRGSDQS